MMGLLLSTAEAPNLVMAATVVGGFPTRSGISSMRYKISSALVSPILGCSLEPFDQNNTVMIYSTLEVILVVSELTPETYIYSFGSWGQFHETKLRVKFTLSFKNIRLSFYQSSE